MHFEWAKSAYPDIDPKAPFSNEFITQVQTKFIETNGPGPLALGSDQARDIRVHLPNVEDILNSGK